MTWSDTGRHAVGGIENTRSVNLALNSTVAGNMIAVLVTAWNSGAVPTISVSDSANGSYGAAVFTKTVTGNLGSNRVSLYVFPNNAGGNLTINATTNITSDTEVFAREFAGGVTSSPLSGGPHTASGSTSPASTGQMTPADNDVLLLAGVVYDSASTMTENAGGEGFTLSDKRVWDSSGGQPGSFVFKIISGAPGSPSHSWALGASGSWAAGIAAFKPAAATTAVGSKTIGRGTYPLREPQFIRPVPPPPPIGRVFYVATTGNDNNPGTQAQPWRHIGTAAGGAKNLQPNDTVIVLDGTYTEQVEFSDGGDATGYVTLRAQNKWGALIRPPQGAYSTLGMGANYIAVDGFDIVGGDGHAIDADHHHHLLIKNNYLHDSQGSGVGLQHVEFVTIEDNVSEGNCATNGYQTSGISIYQATTEANDTVTTGFRNIIRRNISFNNLETWRTNDHTDGNGIIIDDFNNTQGGGESGGYPYPTLVENNLCYGNGGKGIQVAWSNKVTLRNNTCYHNNIDTFNPGTWRAELSNQSSNNNTWVNNIAWAVPGSGILSKNVAIGDFDGGGGNSNVLWYNNITFNGTVGQSSIERGGSANPSLSQSSPYNNIFGTNPVLVNVGTDFHLASGSPCIDAGTSSQGVAEEDLEGRPRVAGNSVDMGCYEDQG
jgi:hypothetical protein